MIRRRVLVTGGAGFLGRHVSAALASKGMRVVVLDDLSARSSTFECAELDSAQIVCHLGSIGDRGLVQGLVRDSDVVIHFASVVGVEHTMSNTIPTMENLAGTIHIVEALESHHTVLFGSSADVYGMHAHLYDRPMREDDLMLYESPEINRWVYPKIKALEENLIAHSGARAINIRIFNSYGPGMDFPGARRGIPKFIENALARQPMKISGDGSQRRAFCFFC